MTMRLSGLATLCATLAFLSAPAHALTYSKHPDEAPDENAIVATGTIEVDEAFRFQVYLSRLPSKAQARLHLNSTGGSVQGAMAMGRIVHEARISTFVTMPSARCNSACTTVFLAGRDRATGLPYRVKGSTNSISFHNFVPVLQDKTYTDVDFKNAIARAQNTVFVLASYYREIDASIELLGLGLKHKDMYLLPNELALRHGIHVLDTNTNELIRHETFARLIRH
jgi:hypothetical protein